jgi:hypothetical protein
VPLEIAEYRTVRCEVQRRSISSAAALQERQAVTGATPCQPGHLQMSGKSDFLANTAMKEAGEMVSKHSPVHAQDPSSSSDGYCQRLG